MNPADEIRKKKRERLRKLLSAINEGPKTLDDLKEIAKDVNLRALRYNLHDLQALGLIFFDESAGKYFPQKSKIPVFKSKRDYEIALKHSRELMCLDREYMKHLDTSWIQLLLYQLELVNLSDSSPLDPTYQRGVMLTQHIRTGYSDVAKLLEELEKLEPEINLIIKRIREKDHDFFGMFGPGFAPPLEEKYLTPDEVKREAELKTERDKRLSWLSNKEKTKIEEYDKLYKLLIGELVFMASSVKNEIPLQGYCDRCPQEHFSIRDLSPRPKKDVAKLLSQ